MTLDEAIKHCLEVADDMETKANTYGIQKTYLPNSQKPVNCLSCAAEHRQLAEWLTKLKEAKRLLKAAVEDFKVIGKALDADCDILINCEECPLQSGHYNCRSWNHQDEALALIGEDTNAPASADDTNVGHKSGGWISVKDRLPNHYEEVLVVSKLENIVYFAWYDADISMFMGHSHMWTTREATHWMPLPEPPEE